MIKDKCKICRRAGQKLFLKGERCLSPKCAMVKRAYPPGLEKKRKSGAPSGYKKALNEKQKLRNWYGLSERQFKKYVKKTLEKRGKVPDIAEELIKKLEKRLDSVIFNLGLAKSRTQARQLVSHGYFLVNNKPVDVPSFETKKGDIVAVKETKKKRNIFREIAAQIKKKELPHWLEIDADQLVAKIKEEPSLAEVSPPAEISVIFEFYSR
ncbi:30S ribosomal protein S4 [Patescibacteria group bacterium]|nr:30S ribosomal protein S4 [Patescibacteria group bacterium]MBU4367908.1 30S ribosomal protein S4 [Patescibacteria group bacterium]MBU4461915.1 30S ribosomal protein S4 [Patescibacteria group bacterium]MCG2699858.1 30S ribosomal protein S4 [Candidatus Parcubacteria bacterium]